MKYNSIYKTSNVLNVIKISFHPTVNRWDYKQMLADSSSAALRSYDDCAARTARDCD